MMKAVQIKYYDIREKEKPEVLDEIIIVGKDCYDVITWDGEFLPAWVEYWGKIEFPSK